MTLLLLIFDIIAATILVSYVAYLLYIYIGERKRRFLRNKTLNSQKTFAHLEKVTSDTGEISKEKRISNEAIEFLEKTLLEKNDRLINKVITPIPFANSEYATKDAGISSGPKIVSNEPIEISVEDLLDTKGKWVSPLDISLRIIRSGYRFSTEDLLQLINSDSERGRSIIHTLAQCGYVFTFDELMALQNPKEPRYGNSIASSMVANGSFFTLEQILALGELNNQDTISLPLEMARHGYQFTFEEILRIKNPADDFGITLAHLCIHKSAQIDYRGYHNNWMSSSGEPYEEYKYSVFNHSYNHIFNNPPFTVEQLIQLGNPADKDGDTIAHWMAKADHIFTEKDLMQLGDPRNKKGESIAYIMARKGEKLTHEEMLKLDIPQEVQVNKEYLDIKNSEMVPGFEYPGWAYEFYFNGRLTYNYCDGGDMFTSIHILNQEAWSIYLDYLKRTYSRKFIDMKFIESLGYKYRECFQVIVGPPSARYFPDQAVS